MSTFRQVDVFTDKPFLGNPLAVVLDAAPLDDVTIRRIARWTNLSETTFVLPPSSAASDYRVRIMTPDTELMFAGHPTLGTCAALLAEGKIKPRDDGTVIQECGVGLVTIRVLSASPSSGTVIGRFAFRAPDVRQLSPPIVNAQDVYLAVGSPLTKGVGAELKTSPQVVDIGIAWLLAEVVTQDALLSAKPSTAALTELCRVQKAFGVTIFALCDSSSNNGYDLELRTFLLENGKLVEDPVCGSANACVAHFIQKVPSLKARVLDGGAKNAYVARQGSVLHREGRVYVTYEGPSAVPWIAGDVSSVITGSINT